MQHHKNQHQRDHERLEFLDGGIGLACLFDSAAHVDAVARWQAVAQIGHLPPNGVGHVGRLGASHIGMHGQIALAVVTFNHRVFKRDTHRAQLGQGHFAAIEGAQFNGFR